MRKHRILYIFSIVFLCIMIPCTSVLIAKSIRAKEPIRIIYIPKTTDPTNEFWSALIGGVKMAAKEYNVKLKIVSPNVEEDYNRQNELIEWAIKQKPDAIALSPADYSKTTSAAEDVVKNKIKLVFIDSSVDKIYCFFNSKISHVKGFLCNNPLENPLFQKLNFFNRTVKADYLYLTFQPQTFNCPGHTKRGVFIQPCDHTDIRVFF